MPVAAALVIPAVPVCVLAFGDKTLHPCLHHAELQQSFSWPVPLGLQFVVGAQVAMLQLLYNNSAHAANTR